MSSNPPMYSAGYLRDALASDAALKSQPLLEGAIDLLSILLR